MSFQGERVWQNDIHAKLKEIFDFSIANNEDWTTQFKSFLLKELPEVLTSLPWLNETPIHNLRTNQVVRFRGMIQDMLNPEFYMDTYILQDKDGNEQKRPGRYLDAVSCLPNETILMDSPLCEANDRNSYLCISTPGESQWVKQIYEDQNLKHRIVSTSNIIQTTNKRGLCEEETEISSIEESTEMSEETESLQQEGKKLKSDDKTSDTKKTTNNDPLYFPFPNANGIACLLKTYEDYDLMLNDVIEVVGILSMDPILSNPGQEDMEQDTELKERSLPPSLVPRLHVLTLNKKLHCNPLLPTVIEKEKLPVCSSNIRELIGSIFDVLFLGDELAAEYFICHLISSVYIRQDIIPLGKFSINLSGITQELQDKNYPKLIYNLLSTLTTHNYFFPMTIDNMNTLDFVPSKDYQENCLKSGLLQLPRNLHLVVDETQLSAGKLDTKGIMNLAALKNLIDWQKVDYDFQYHNLEQLTDIPIVILSEGKSMISCNFQIKLDPKHTDVTCAFSQIESLLTPQVLENLRTHLTLARLSSYKFSEDMQQSTTGPRCPAKSPLLSWQLTLEEVVQNDFVSSRKHEGGMTESDLHNLLTLARLLVQSCGKEELTEEVWKSAKMLETERKCRLRTESS